MEPRFLVHAIGRAGAAVSQPGVERIEEAGLQAVCTPFGDDADADDPEWLAAAVQRHHAAIRNSFETGPVLPIRFGTVMEERAVAPLLIAHHDRFAAVLDRFHGLEEWGVKLLCNPASLARGAARASETVRALDAEIAASGPGRAYLLQRRRDAALAEALEASREAVVAHCRERLLATAVEAADLPAPRAAEARPEEMIANLAFLLPHERADEFTAAADALPNEHEGLWLIVEMSGPWPPYSFVDLELGAGSDLDAGA